MSKQHIELVKDIKVWRPRYPSDTPTPFQKTTQIEEPMLLSQNFVSSESKEKYGPLLVLAKMSCLKTCRKDDEDPAKNVSTRALSIVKSLMHMSVRGLPHDGRNKDDNESVSVESCSSVEVPTEDEDIDEDVDDSSGGVY